MLELKRLRDLPGVMEIERLCGVAEAWNDDNRARTRDRIDEVSISLFGLPYGLLEYDDFDWEDDEDPPTLEQWDCLMANALRPYADTAQFWTQAMGWDVTNGNGCELECAHWFAAQIIICESNWIDGVVFSPDGSGKEPDYEQAELSEEELSEKLEREVRAFLTRRAA